MQSSEVEVAEEALVLSACPQAQTLIPFAATEPDGNPVAQGWQTDTTTGAIGRLLTDLEGPAFEADGTVGRATWRMAPTTMQNSLAAANGWRLRFRARVISGGSNGAYYANGSKYFLVRLSILPNGDLVASPDGAASQVLVSESGVSAYHDYEFTYQPSTGQGTFAFDGVPITTWAGTATTQNTLTFGQFNSSEPGAIRFKSLSFEINGSSVYDYAAAPTWVPELTGTATGSVATDLNAPAWRVNAPTGKAIWKQATTSTTNALAASHGWRLTAVMRVASGEANAFYYQTPSRRDRAAIKLTSSGSLTATLDTGGTHTLLTSNGAALYHEYQLEFQPSTGTTTFRFDGQVVATSTGLQLSGPSEVAWGHDATTVAGVAYFRSIRFELLGVNPIVAENACPGTAGWKLAGPAPEDLTRAAHGYASMTSVNKGGSIDFHISVSVTNGTSYTINIYRMGYYGGQGARLMQSLSKTNGATGAPCLDPNHDPTRIESAKCEWPLSHTLQVPADWTTGIYLAKVKNGNSNIEQASYIMFAVRDDARAADFLYQQAVLTYQAYNRYPLGGVERSFYYGQNYGPSAEIVYLDRPYTTVPGNGHSSEFRDGASGFQTWDLPMIKWLEKSGYDVSYATNVDVHQNPAQLLKYDAILSVGHDEYWTAEMNEALRTARDGGVHLAVFSGNTAYRTVTLNLDPEWRSARRRNDPAVHDSTVSPGDHDYTEDEEARRQELLALARTGCCERDMDNHGTGDNGPDIDHQGLPYIVVAPSGHWLMSGINNSDVDSILNMLSLEADTASSAYGLPAHLSLVNIAESPYETGTWGTQSFHISPAPVASQSVLYQAPSGAWVFNAGVTDWSWALSDVAILTGYPLVQDRAGIQGITRNILNKFRSREAQSPLIFEATAVTGPTAFDWQGNVSASGYGQSIWDLGNPAFEASAPAGAQARWTQTLTPAQIAEARAEGWRLVFVARVQQGTSRVAYYADGVNSIMPLLNLDSNGRLTISIAGVGGGPIELMDSHGGDDYHTYEIYWDGDQPTHLPIPRVGDPASAKRKAWFRFDGNPLNADGIPLDDNLHEPIDLGTDWQGTSTNENVISFGKHATDGAGVVRFRGVGFEINGKSEVASFPRRRDLQGWTADLSGTATGMLVSDLGAPAWRAYGVGGRATWYIEPTAYTKSRAATVGWKLSAKIRVVSGTENVLYYADGARRFLARLGIGQNGSLVANLEGGGSIPLLGTGGSTAYHDFEIRFNPSTNLATLLFDGNSPPGATWPGSNTTQNRIAWGEGSTSSNSESLYRTVRFDLVDP